MPDRRQLDPLDLAHHRRGHATYVSAASDVTLNPIGFSFPEFEVRYAPAEPFEQGAELFRFRHIGPMERDVNVDQIGMSVDHSLDVAWGPNLVSIQELTNLVVYVMRIVAEIGDAVDDPGRLDFLVRHAAALRDLEEWAESSRKRRSARE